MANKKQTEIFKKQEKEKRFYLALEDVKIFPWLAVAACAVAALLFFLNFSAIYNTDLSGNEIWVTGYHYVFAALTNGFTSPNEALYGSIDIFNHFAPSAIVTTGICSLLGLIFTAACLALSVIAGAWKKYGLALYAFISAAAGFIALFVAFIASLSAGPAMIAGYCLGNPKCSLTSLAILPALAIAAAAVLSFLMWLRFNQAKKIRA